MSISEEAIVTCAKIAGDIVAKLPHNNVDGAMLSFNKMYHVVLQGVKNDIDELVNHRSKMAKDRVSEGGRQVPIRTEDEIRNGIAEITRNNGRVKLSDSAFIKGQLHGEVPQWLAEAMTKAGVTEVFDNRGTATAENRRPHFVSTDGNNTPFWPPRKASFKNGAVSVS